MKDYKKILDLLKPLLKQYVKVGMYIEWGNLVLMIYNKEGKLMDWFSLEQKEYDLLTEYFMEEIYELPNTGKESSK